MAIYLRSYEAGRVDAVEDDADEPVTRGAGECGDQGAVGGDAAAQPEKSKNRAAASVGLRLARQLPTAVSMAPAVGLRHAM